MSDIDKLIIANELSSPEVATLFGYFLTEDCSDVEANAIMKRYERQDDAYEELDFILCTRELCALAKRQLKQ